MKRKLYPLFALAIAFALALSACGQIPTLVPLEPLPTANAADSVAPTEAPAAPAEPAADEPAIFINSDAVEVVAGISQLIWPLKTYWAAQDGVYCFSELKQLDAGVPPDNRESCFTPDMLFYQSPDDGWIIWYREPGTTYKPLDLSGERTQFWLAEGDDGAYHLWSRKSSGDEFEQIDHGKWSSIETFMADKNVDQTDKDNVDAVINAVENHELFQPVGWNGYQAFPVRAVPAPQ